MILICKNDFFVRFDASRCSIFPARQFLSRGFEVDLFRRLRIALGKIGVRVIAFWKCARHIESGSSILANQMRFWKFFDVSVGIVMRHCAIDMLDSYGIVLASCTRSARYRRGQMRTRLGERIFYEVLTAVWRLFMVLFDAIWLSMPAAEVNSCRIACVSLGNRLSQAGKMVRKGFHHSRRRHNMLCI